MQIGAEKFCDEVTAHLVSISSRGPEADNSRFLKGVDVHILQGGDEDVAERNDLNRHTKVSGIAA